MSHHQASQPTNTLLIKWGMCCALFFVILAAWVNMQPIPALDSAIMMSFRRADDLTLSVGPAWVAVHFRDITTLGSNWFLLVITGLASIACVKTGHRRYAVFLLLTVISGMVLSFALKYGFHRPRPALVPHITKVYTSSFPSGHAMMSTLTYMSLAYVGSRIIGSPSLVRWFWGTAFTVVIFVGVSRVFLGVHWPTDIMAGWCAAFVWLALCLCVMQKRAR